MSILINNYLGLIYFFLTFTLLFATLILILYFQCKKNKNKYLTISNEYESLLQEKNRLQEKNIEMIYTIKFWQDKYNSAKAQEEALKSLEENNAKNFEYLSRKIIEENNKKFNDLAKEKIDISLNPVKTQFDDLKQHITSLKKEQTEYTTSLKEQISYVTQKADNLNNILKVDKKFQGSWGEFQLERLLEIAGLIKGVDYTKEARVNIDNADRVDIMISLPDNKHIMIDSKVSLNEYQKYLIAEQKQDIVQQEFHLQCLRTNIKKQIDSLQYKSYNQSQKYDSIEYTLMFVPIEQAYQLAFEDYNLSKYAWDRNVVPVSPANLYATLKIIASVISLEKRKQTVSEIISLAEKMLKKLNDFYGGIDNIIKRLDKVREQAVSISNNLKDNRRNSISYYGKQMIALGNLDSTLKHRLKNDHNEDIIDTIPAEQEKEQQ